MYMGVIPCLGLVAYLVVRAPHVYGGDPYAYQNAVATNKCSPCIWG